MRRTDLLWVFIIESTDATCCRLVSGAAPASHNTESMADLNTSLTSISPQYVKQIQCLWALLTAAESGGGCRPWEDILTVIFCDTEKICELSYGRVRVEDGLFVFLDVFILWMNFHRAKHDHTLYCNNNVSKILISLFVSLFLLHLRNKRSFIPTTIMTIG